MPKIGICPAIGRTRSGNKEVETDGRGWCCTGLNQCMKWSSTVCIGVQLLTAAVRVSLEPKHTMK